VGTEYVKETIAGSEPYMLIDSRPKNKFLKGHIPSAVNISDSQFDKYKGMLPRDKSTQLIFYCGGYKCPLSHKSADKAEALGYTSVRIDEAGYPGWKKKYGAAKAVEVQQGEAMGTMSVEQFKEIIENDPESIRLIDVRDPDEFKKGHLPGAENMTVEEVQEKIDEFEADKPIVFICSTGARSGECFYMMLDKREEIMDKVYYIEATIEYGEDGSYKIIPNK
jgi:rhodanese-related sulfurtransferase